MTLDSNISSKINMTEDHDLDAESLSAIRSILTEEAGPKPQVASQPAPVDDAHNVPRDVAPLRRKVDALPPLQSPEAGNEAVKVASKPKRGFSLRRKRATEAPAAPIPTRTPATPKAAPRTSADVDKAGLMDRIKAYRPKPVHVVFGAIALLVLMRPWLVFGLALLTGIILVGVFMMVGYDGFWKGMMKMGRWYAKRNPERAVVLNKRLDDFAMRWDAILDRFPEGTVDGLYLPDFGELSIADQRHDEALERRLAGLSEKTS